MSFNPQGASPIPLEIFGGLCTEMAPETVPPGLSPWCAEIDHEPGSVFSRPAFQKVFATPFGSCTTVWGATYPCPTGITYNLYADSNGQIWVQNVTSSPSTYAALVNYPPGAKIKHCVAFGRIYLAISDGLHGADVALQFDGTNIDRVTQGGPGAPPNVGTVSYPTVNMAAAGSTITLAVTSTAAGSHSLYYNNLVVNVSSGALALLPGVSVTIAGNSNTASNITSTVLVVESDTQFILANISATNPAGTGGTAAFGANATMSRSGNIVKVTTATAHSLQVGYQAQINGVPASTVGTSISAAVIDNENYPGLATITTAIAHGLSPGLFVSLNNIAATTVGGGILSITRSGQIVTVVTNSANNISAGAIVTIAGVATSSFNYIGPVISVVSATNSFTYLQVDVDASDATGTVAVNWPEPTGPTPTYFEVVSAPTPTTFQVEVFYSDGTWNGGTVSYAWDGIFFVQSVPTSTTFTYQQYGPPAFTSAVGTVTPYGQVAPGQHQCQVSFLTRQGYITKCSTPFLFTANGGQYVTVSNIPIGPANVVARILQFTGAQGGFFFYIPATPQINGQIVGTATQINDNTTTQIVLDFSDNTLFNALGTSIQGNNLQLQTVIDGALGFGYYEDRLITYGQRNQIQNMLNMAFDGGYLPNAPTVPNGWIPDAVNGAGGHLVSGVGFGFSFQFNSSALGFLRQSFYQDAYGNPIANPNITYAVRFAFQSLGGGSEAIFTVSSVLTGFVSTVTFTGGSSAGAYQQVTLPTAMPEPIPPDLTFYIGGANGVIDEISVIPLDSPYLNGCFGSYVENPEAFDGLSGDFGPDDTQPVMDLGIIRDNLYFLTQDPGGRLHETIGGNTEPADWVVNEVASDCGAISAFSLTHSQADDSTGAGGEDWFAYYSSTGPRIFGGQAPDKIAQEIMRIGPIPPGGVADLNALNVAAQLSVWGVNDPKHKKIWFGIPTGSATAPSIIYQLSYSGSNSASEISENSSFHNNIQGQLVARDLGRKWAPWNRPMNGAALMTLSPGNIVPVFFGGNGSAPVAGTGYGNVYTLSFAKYTDDDYGQFAPIYTTYAFPSRTQELGIQGLGSGMKMLSYFTCFIEGIGTVTITPYVNLLTNAWSITGVYALQASAKADLEWGGGQVSGQRIFFQFATTPLSAQTDNQFSLTALTAFLKQNKHLPVRGVYP